MNDLRAELLTAARAYCTAQPITTEVAAAWEAIVETFERYVNDDSGDYLGDESPAVYAIGDYIEAEEVDEGDYLYMEEILSRPACGKCGADGYTIHHADSTTAAPIWQCAKCHHIGYG